MGLRTKSLTDPPGPIHPHTSGTPDWGQRSLLQGEDLEMMRIREIISRQDGLSVEIHIEIGKWDFPVRKFYSHGL